MRSVSKTPCAACYGAEAIMQRTYALGALAVVAACGGRGTAPYGGEPGLGDDAGGVFGGDARARGDAEYCAASSVAATKGQVDVIFIVDTSGSMSDEIAQVKANINRLSASIGK